MTKHLLVALLLLGIVAVPVANAQLKKPDASVKVTFLLNTSTVPDTALNTVTVTGDKAALTNFGNGISLTKLGGDYWAGQVTFNSGDTVRYKFRVNGAWEANPLDPAGFSPDNRGLLVGNADTTLPVQFFNSKGNGTPQWAKPWGTTPDSIMVVWFRVNMQAFASKPFNKNTDTVAVRGDKSGGTWGDPGFGWSPSRYLAREAAAANGGFTYDATNFWSGAVMLHKSHIAVGDTSEYKFLIGFDWGKEEANNRKFIVPTAKHDTTIYWVWYNNEAPIPPPPYKDTCVVTFRTNMTTAFAKGGFAVGDTIQVQSGFFGTAVENGRTKNLARLGLTALYQVTDTIIAKLDSTLDYQYYLVKGGNAQRENYFNFQFTGPSGSSEAERRKFKVSSKAFTVLDTVTSVVAGRRQPEFANQTKLAHNVRVKWVVDMRPAYYQVKYGHNILAAIQGPDSLKNIDSIKVWGVAINGPATGGPNGPLPVDWATWDRGIAQDTSHRRMWDDGFAGGHGDQVAGDSLFTVQFLYTSANIKGQVFKFGIRGSDNESAFGLNHLENISDADTQFTINAQWGSINPNFYNKWDYNLRKPVLTGVEELTGIAQVYALAQNYPNPFNPSTKIEFSLPKQSAVDLKVFNILGQEVATLVHATLNAGQHAVSFDARNLASGLYFYRISAGEFSSVKKMMLLK